MVAHNKRHAVPIAELPDGRLVYEDELDLTPIEKVRAVVLGIVMVAAALAVAFAAGIVG